METQSDRPGSSQSTGVVRRPPRKALCSIGHGRYEELLRLSSPTFINYAAKHGYDVVLRFVASAGQRPIAWAKVGLIQQLLADYEIVLWIDADAVIIDDTIDLASEVAPGDWMCLCRHRTTEGLVPNTGVWMFTSSHEATAFLAKLDAHRGFEHHPWWENAAVIDLLGYQFDPVRPEANARPLPGVRYLDKAWNSVGADPADEPRIKHYPGLPLDVRVHSILSDLDNSPIGTVRFPAPVGSVRSNEVVSFSAT